MTVDAAMGIGAAATLWQRQEDGQFQAVTHHSRGFSKSEKNYCQMEAESLAVVFGILRNKLYLYGLPRFSVETDHKPLADLSSNREDTG